MNRVSPQTGQQPPCWESCNEELLKYLVSRPDTWATRAASRSKGFRAAVCHQFSNVAEGHIFDLVTASVLMAMGMMMVPPAMISLPIKLLLFVMVDGWNLVVGSLARSIMGG